MLRIFSLFFLLLISGCIPLLPREIHINIGGRQVLGSEQPVKERRMGLLKVFERNANGRLNRIGSALYDFKTRKAITNAHVVGPNFGEDPLVVVFITGEKCSMDVANFVPRIAGPDVALLVEHDPCYTRAEPTWFLEERGVTDLAYGAPLTLVGYARKGTVAHLNFTQHDRAIADCVECFSAVFEKHNGDLFRIPYDFGGSSGGAILRGDTVVGMMCGLNLNLPLIIYAIPYDVVKRELFL